MEFLTSLKVQTTVPGTPSLIAQAVSAGGVEVDHIFEVQGPDGSVLANIDGIGRIETKNIIYGACPIGPEGIFSADVGTIFINSGDNTTVAVNTGVYYKASGTGLTGWVALASVDPSVGAVPVGGMIAYTGSETSPPTGWVWADGLGLDPGNAAYNALRTKYAGNPYGVDANSWTRKPNAVGRSLIGLGATWAPGGIGTAGGSNTRTLTLHELPNHGHINYDGGHRHGEGIQYVGHKPSNDHTGQHFLETSLPNEHAYWFEMPMVQGGGYIVPVGDGAAFSIMNPYLLVRVMVKL